MTKYYLVDFFCGCGGTSLGFKQAGWDIAMGIDNDPKAFESYKANFPNAKFINKDIRHVKPEDFKAELENHPNYKNCKEKKIAFSLCSPCQPFSTNNRNRLNENDERLNLLDECIKFIELIKPDFIFLENVPGMKLDKEKGSFSKFLQCLKANDYGEQHKIINASHYGVPQNRKRLVLIACKGQQDISYPETTHADDDLLKEKQKPVTTVKETIGYLHKDAPITDGEYENSEYHELHKTRKLSKDPNTPNFDRMRATPTDGGSRFDWPPNLELECHKNMKNKGFGNVYGRMWWNKPAPTLTTKFTSISCGRFGHPEQNRAITLLEGLLLQSFPSTYKLKGNFEDKARQIGNAVPPKLAKVFAEHFKTLI